jgi:hypothetical protein
MPPPSSGMLVKIFTESSILDLVWAQKCVNYLCTRIAVCRIAQWRRAGVIGIVVLQRRISLGEL